MTADSGASPLRPEHFRRVDESDDSVFYAQPRLVTHLDEAAVAAVRRFYGEVLPPGGAILDLMSSWVSHLPEPMPYASVTGLGMNRFELEQNPVLSRRSVHDLNRDPVLPYANDEFDGVVCTVSVQYLVRPVDIFREVARVLRPGGPFVVTYSNRCFPTKAVAAWSLLGDREHAELVGLYFRLAGGFDQPQAYDLSPAPGRSDPVFAVLARRSNERPSLGEGRVEV